MNRASRGGWSTSLRKRSKNSFAPGPPIASFVWPFSGRSRILAMRQRGIRQRVGPSVSRAGPGVATRPFAAAGSRSVIVTSGCSIRTGSIAGARSSETSEATISRAAASRSSVRPVAPRTIWGRRPRRRIAASRCGRSIRRLIVSRRCDNRASDTRARGVTSAPKNLVPRRRSPRTGAKPSPCRRAVSTAAAHATPRITSFGRLCQRLVALREPGGGPPRRETADLDTGNRCALRQRLRGAGEAEAQYQDRDREEDHEDDGQLPDEPLSGSPLSGGVPPPSPGLGVQVGQSTEQTGRSLWGFPEGELEREELDPAGDVEADAGDVRGQVRAQERDRVRDVLRVARPAERGPFDDPLVHLRVREMEGLRA